MTRIDDIATHLHTLATTVDAAERELHRRMDAHDAVTFAARIRRCGRVLTYLDLVAVAEHLAEQRTIANGGRPRTGSTGVRTLGTSTTEAIGTELARLRDYGLSLAEAMDRLHPDPAWPTAPGARTRTSTSTEHLAGCCGAAWGTLSPINAWADLRDAVEGVEASTQELRRSVQRAMKVRAWHADPADVDPPPLVELCACGNHATEHHHPDTGTVLRADLCDDCWRKLCPRCWTRDRRTPGAKECQSCADRDQRARRTAA